MGKFTVTIKFDGDDDHDAYMVRQEQTDLAFALAWAIGRAQQEKPMTEFLGQLACWLMEDNTETPSDPEILEAYDQFAKAAAKLRNLWNELRRKQVEARKKGGSPHA